MSYYKAIYEKLFPYAPYLNERIGLELLIETGQDPMEALEEAWQKVHDFRNKHIQAELAHQYEPIGEEQMNAIQVQKPPSGQSLEEQIRQCTTMKELTEFRLLADMHLKLKTAYSETLNKINSHEI